MLSRLYRKSGNLGSEGTPNAVWLTSDPAGQFFLVSYPNSPGQRQLDRAGRAHSAAGPPGRQRYLGRLVRPEDPITDRQRSLTLWA